MKRSIARWVVLGDLMVSYGTEGDAEAAMWSRYIGALSTNKIARLLATSNGRLGITSVQRNAMSDVLRRGRISTAVVTDERLVIGLVTAVSWLGADIKAFSWPDLRSAVTHLRVPSHLVERTIETVMQLRLECKKDALGAER